jgi:FG-GAP repeat
MKRAGAVAILLSLIPAANAVAQFSETNVPVLRIINGPSAFANFGAWINNAGDADGDMVADLIVGAPDVNDGTGAAYLYSGRTGALLFTFVPDAAAGHFGVSVSAAGDLNGDGAADIAVGAPDIRSRAGSVYLYSGRDGVLIRRLDGAGPGSEFGFAPGPIADTNGDGTPDVLVGAQGVADSRGAVYIFSGRDGTLLRTVNGRNARERFGSAVNSLRDITGDGKAEILAGALDRPPNGRGGADVISGAGDDVLFAIPGDDFSRELGWAYVSDAGDVDADGKNDILAGDFAHDGTVRGSFAGRAWVYSGADFHVIHVWDGTPQSGLGETRAAGDVNGDGYGDLLIGAYNDQTRAEAAGRVSVYSGKDGSELLRLTCRIRGDQFGVDVAAMGDVNGDGLADFAVSAPGADGPAGSNQGSVYILSGANIPQSPRDQPQDLLVSSRFSNAILRYDGTTGAFRRVFASGNGLANPNGIAYGRDGRLYAGLGDTGVILRFDGQSGQFVDAFVHDDPATAVNETGGLSAVRAIAFGPDGHLYVDDGPNNRVMGYDGATGRFLGVMASGSDLRGPVGLTFGPDGTMYVGGALSGAAYAFRSGVFVRRYACPDQASVTGVLIGADGRLYAADASRNAVYRFDVATGECLGAFASGGGLNVPIGLAWAPDGNLLVGSFNTNSVIKYDRLTGALIGTFVQAGAGGLSGTHNFALVPFPAPPPELAIVRPRRDSIVGGKPEVVVQTANFELDCVNTSNVTGRGRLRIDVDGQFDRESCQSSVALTGTYASGEHVIAVSLLNNDGTALSPPVAAEQPFRIAPDLAYVPQLAVPGVAKVQGAGGTFFRTTMWMTNTHADSILVRLRFVPAEGFSDGGVERLAFVELDGGHMIRFADVLTDAFALSINTAGVVVVEIEEDRPLPVVAARTFNDTPGGTLGQYIPAVPIERGASAIRLHGLAGDTSARTNVGVMNLSASPLTAVLSLIDSDGIQQGADIGVTVRPWSSWQIGAFNRAAGLQDVSSFSVRMMTALPRAFLYASKLDNKTSDPIFVSHVPARSRQWIDGVGSISGSGGTQFRSFLTLTNDNESAAVATIAYTPRGATSAVKTLDVEIPARHSISYNDAAAELLQMTGTSGTLMLSASPSTPISAWARTYNDRGAAGTLGQFIPSFGPEDLVGTAGAILPGISHNQAVRCNLGLVNTAVAATAVTITAYDAEGVAIASKVYQVQGGQTLLIGGVLIDIGAGQQNDTYLIVEASIPGAVYAWASFVDNRSTDPTFVRPFLLQ